VVGHGIAAEPVEKDGRVVAVRTTWLPRATVPRVKTRDNVPDVLVGMEDLAALPDAATARMKLSPLVEHYAAWIATQRATRLDTPGRRSTLEGSCAERNAPGIGSRQDRSAGTRPTGLRCVPYRQPSDGGCGPQAQPG